MSQPLINYLQDNSLTILNDALVDVRATGGPSLAGVSDDDLKVALYTVLLKIIDALNTQSDTGARGPEGEEGKRDVRSLFLGHMREIMDFIDGQSSYTTGHTAAVVRHVVQMASRLAWTDPQIDDLEATTWVHNIGLLNQSHRLTTLPRNLTQDELKQARNHTVVGAEIIRPISFLAHMVPAVRYHHHRYDGGNHPGEPAGENLPLSARIISLADAYQAMLEPRAYRPALTRDQALLEIDKGSGTQFDPRLVPLAHELS